MEEEEVEEEEWPRRSRRPAWKMAGRISPEFFETYTQDLRGTAGEGREGRRLRWNEKVKVEVRLAQFSKGFIRHRRL